jgi:hypothetical protein
MSGCPKSGGCPIAATPFFLSFFFLFVVVLNFFFIVLVLYIYIFINSDMCHYFIGVDVVLNGIRQIF